MQYAEMKDLLVKAEEAGGDNFSEEVNQALAETFASWLATQNLGEITEEEEHDLRMAFEKGYGICFHPRG